MSSKTIAMAISGIIGVVIVMGIVANTTTTGWDPTVAMLFPYIPLALIASVVIGLFAMGLARSGKD